MTDDNVEAAALSVMALAEELSHELRTPLTSLTSYLSLMDRRIERLAEGSQQGHGDFSQLGELTDAALADAARLRTSLDRLLARGLVPPNLATPALSNPNAPQTREMGDRRFDKLWQAWDARLAAGESQVKVQAGLSEKQLAEMLAADAGMTRSRDRNCIATELTNRLARRRADPSSTVILAAARSVTRGTRLTSDLRRLIEDVKRTRTAAEQARATRGIGRTGR